MPGGSRRRIIGDRPNTVHLTILGVQSWRIFKISSPFLGRYCFVRRFTVRGLERPFKLVKVNSIGDRPPLFREVVKRLEANLLTQGVTL